MRAFAPPEAPQWAHDMCRNIQNVIDNIVWPYVRRTPILVGDLPDATLYAWKKFYVSNGTGGRTEVTSNGVAWHYPDGGVA